MPDEPNPNPEPDPGRPPINGGPDRASFGVYLTDDGKGWVPVNRSSHWPDDAEPVEGAGPAKSWETFFAP
jgi:hypothetical protein